MSIKNFILFLFLTAILWVVTIFGQSNNPTLMSQWIFDAYNKKEQTAKKIKGKKVIVVAGSNALFGIDSKILSSYFKLPVVNDGVNAGIYLPLILEISKRIINKGDIVLAPLEPNMYSYNHKVGVQVIDYLFARKPLFFWDLSFKEQFYILWHIEFERIWKGYNYRGGSPLTAGFYGAFNIDQNGDQINTSLKFKNQGMFKDLERHHKNPEHYGAEFSTEALGWDYLEKFVSWCNKRDVKVIFVPATLMKHPSYFNDPIEKEFYDKKIIDEVKKRGWTFIGKPHNYMYDSSFYFNTNFHLTQKGKIMRTRQLIKDLKSSLKK